MKIRDVQPHWTWIRISVSETNYCARTFTTCTIINVNWPFANCRAPSLRRVFRTTTVPCTKRDATTADGVPHLNFDRREKKLFFITGDVNLTRLHVLFTTSRGKVETSEICFALIIMQLQNLISHINTRLRR